MPECSECGKLFSLNKNLYQHLRVKHRVLPPLPRGKIPCPRCPEWCRTHRDLRAHLGEGHGEALEREEHTFPNTQAFEEWKRDLEEGSGWGYVRRISEKVLRSRGEAKTHFICHRSGVYRSESTGQRRPKKTGTSKIGTTCPSVMEVSRSLSDGSVNVLFWKTHFGHDMDTAHPPRRTTRKQAADGVAFGVCAVVPAAGVGERLGAPTPKQFIRVHGKPIIRCTVEAFCSLPFISKVVVVCARDALTQMLSTLDGGRWADKLVVTEATGDTRHHSIRAGVRALNTCCTVLPEVVVVHDGVRPFFPEEIVTQVVLAAKDHGAAGVTCPLVSTVVSCDAAGFLDASLDRGRFRASEMPQAFHYDVLCKAYDKCSEYDMEHGTECLHLVEKYADVRAKLIPSPSHLWKVTHHKDIYTAAAILKESQAVGIVNSNYCPSMSSFLETVLSRTFKIVESVSKFSVSVLQKYPNLVLLQEESNDPYHLLEQLKVISQGHTQPTTLVQVFVRELDPTLHLPEFQRQARALARELLSHSNILVYFVLAPDREADPSEVSLEEVAELVRSLLFDSNRSISGNVFLS